MPLQRHARILLAYFQHPERGAYERGNPALAKERSNSVAFGLKATPGRARYTVTAFVSHYGSYTALIRSGNSIDGEGNVVSGSTPAGLPEFCHVGVRARFVGLEAGCCRPCSTVTATSWTWPRGWTGCAPTI